MHTETEYNTLQRELQHAREKLALYEGTSRAAGQASRILGVAGGLLLFGPGLSKALLNLGRSWSSTSGPSIEAVLGVAAAIVRRISWGLILGALCAALPLVLLIQQNTLISTQNELIAQQNQLSEASRRAGLMFELTSILDKIDKEMDAANIEKAAMNVKERHTQNYKDEEHRRRANRRSIQPQEREKYQFSERLSGRIVALSRSLNPYRFLERDGRTTPRPLSPERGQLLLSLLETGADLEELNHAQGLTFADADLRNISLLNAVLIHVKLERANFQGADLTGIRFQYGRLDGADFSNARLDSAKLGAVLEGARFFRANLRAASFEGASIKNVDLRCADVANITGWENLDLGGIRLAGAKNIPAGFAAKARNHRVQMDEPGLECNEPML